MSKWQEVAEQDGGVRLAGDNSGKVYMPGEKFSLGMGTIEVRDTTACGLHVARFSSSGKYSWSQIIRPGERYRLGPDYGHRVKRAEEETDPILKVLRELDIPVSLVKKYSEGQVLGMTEFIRDVFRMNHPASGHSWKTDGKIQYIGEDRIKSYKDINQHCADDVSREGIIVDPTWAVEIGEYKAMAGGVYERITKIVVWPSCKPEVLKEALISITKRS